MSYSAQGSITIKRLRNGDTFFISLEIANGIPLYQGVDDKSGTVSPDWTVAANQPIIVPNVTSARGASVALSFHQWQYNGVTLNFNSTTDADGYRLDSTGVFKMNTTTGALRIVKNLASSTNIANDTLSYSCVATVGGTEYNLQKSIDVLIHTVGATSYAGYVNATTEQLTSDITSTVLSTKLWLGASELTNYYVKWYRDNTLWSAKNGMKSITVTNADVDGTQLFIAEFYKDSSSTTPVFRAGIRIIDTSDDYQVICFISSTQKDVDTGSPVTVKAKIVRFLPDGSNQEITPTGVKWRMDVMDRKTWSVVKTANANTIQVTTTETDRNGEMGDVEVVAEAEWN